MTVVGLNDCHFCEKLRELEDSRLRVSRASVRRTLGLPPERRRRHRQARHRRLPEAAMGLMIQVDASPFAWPEGGVPP